MLNGRNLVCRYKGRGQGRYRQGTWKRYPVIQKKEINWLMGILRS